MMNDTAQKARHEINHVMEEVAQSFRLLRIVHVVTWTPPPAVGGYIQNVDLISNIFELHGFRIPSQQVFDCTDRAVGAYERECRRLLRQSLNPLYWLGMLIVWFLHLPFKLLSAAGFDAPKAENSVLGKLVKVVLVLVPFIAAIVKIADDWDMIRRFLVRCVAALHRL